MNTETQIPRRARMDKWIPAERAIYDAAQAVEKLPANTLLTEAVVLLGQAREKVAAYVDSQLTIDGYPIRCEADRNVMRAADLQVGDRFAFRAEDLRSAGLTFYRVTAPGVAEAEAVDRKVDLHPDTLVVRFR
jgi:hypothetical protein